MGIKLKKTSVISILSTLILIAALVSTLWMDDGIGSRIVNVVTVVTAIIGAVALFIQFKKDKQINTASFLMEYSKSFYNDYDLLDAFTELDKHNTDPSYQFDFKKFQPKIVVYLQWIESIASLIEQNTIDLYTIDNIMSYRFFIIVNNKQVQEGEIIPNASFYRGTYYLYDRWYKFEQERGLEIPLESDGLHLTKGYQEILGQTKTKMKK